MISGLLFASLVTFSIALLPKDWALLLSVSLRVSSLDEVLAASPGLGDEDAAVLLEYVSKLDW